YTPATGTRLLLAPTPESAEVADTLIAAALDHARHHNVSSLHWLFTREDDTHRLARHGLLSRTGCQFHWKHYGYRDFDDFLEGLSPEQRKRVKRGRRRVTEAGLEVDVLQGHEMSDHQWGVMSEFYRSTFLRKSGIPTLSRDFFQDIARAV